MRVKICGCTDPQNIRDICALHPDAIGLILYSGSPRAVSITQAKTLCTLVPASVRTVGVFVDERAEDIFAAVQEIPLAAVQLHGNDIFVTARALRTLGFSGEIIGAVPANAEILASLHHHDAITVYLFDTPTALHGGSGKSFDWSLLSFYQGTKPFFLSGGLGIENIAAALCISDPRCIGFDFNSKVESAPGIKDPDSVLQCITKVRYASR